MPEIGPRLSRVKLYGTSCEGGTLVDELIKFNRAGVNESCLTKKEIIQKYIHGSEK